MSSLFTTSSKQKTQRKHMRNNEISEIIKETKGYLNVNNTQHISSNCNNLLNLSNKLKIQSSSLSSVSKSNSVSQIEKKHAYHRCQNKKTTISINKCKQSHTKHNNYHRRNNILSDITILSIDDSKMDTNLNDNNKNSSLINNQTNDKQLNSSTNKSNTPDIISWWEDNQQEIFKNKNDDNDDDEMLITSDEILQKIVDGALNLMLTSSKSKIQKQIQTFIDRKKFRQNIQSKDVHIDSHLEQNVQSLKNNDIITPINPTNLGHQLLEKIGWIPGNGLGLNQDGIKTPIEVNIRNHRQGLGYEKQIDRYQ
ncbi:unnamed protein product [Rotaria sordida]|uniref:G-patch domain-containing protein n=1 Tax=Rotaria sordida TaxID=392033 RepID=A0A815EH58_9BILA|nr:unnamed protein product [Rotaria sordida]